MTVEEYLRLLEVVNKDPDPSPTDLMDRVPTNDEIKKAKRKPSAYSRKYKKEFRRIASQYKNKNGTWKKGGFRKAVKAAHKAVKK